MTYKAVKQKKLN